MARAVSSGGQRTTMPPGLAALVQAMLEAEAYQRSFGRWTADTGTYENPAGATGPGMMPMGFGVPGAGSFGEPGAGNRDMSVSAPDPSYGQGGTGTTSPAAGGGGGPTASFPQKRRGATIGRPAPPSRPSPPPIRPGGPSMSMEPTIGRPGLQPRPIRLPLPPQTRGVPGLRTVRQSLAIPQETYRNDR